MKNIPESMNIYRPRSRLFFICLIALIATIIGTSAPVFAENTDTPINCQVIVSLMELDEDASGMEEKNYDLTFFGAAAQKPFKKDIFEYGFETGANLSMENDTNVLNYSAGSSGGAVRVEIDNQWFLLDYFAGGYIAANFASRFRLYAGAGPLLIYGSWEFEPDENDDEYEDNTESHLSAGIYGRAGLEVAIIEKLSIGAGVRVVTTGLEFNDPPEEIKFEGPQVFFNVSLKI
jgi:opacity protein-like surface antigen